MGGLEALTAKKPFSPEGAGFDMSTARSFGMKGDTTPGPNFGHFGSVVPSTPVQQKQFGLPVDSFMILKGRAHPTFSKAVAAENARGFEVKKRGSRYFSIPKKIGDILNE
tara:strand:+ start:2706 stop:3035 length:330 start_codon:yes stop_codon:yes gene_type:complete